MKLLVDRSLARRDAQGIRLHDFQLDYARGEDPHPEALALERGALLLSTHVIEERSEEIGSQLTGRLLAYQDDPAVTAFLEELSRSAAHGLFLSSLLGNISWQPRSAVRLVFDTAQVGVLLVGCLFHMAPSGSWN